MRIGRGALIRGADRDRDQRRRRSSSSSARSTSPRSSTSCAAASPAWIAVMVVADADRHRRPRRTLAGPARADRGASPYRRVLGYTYIGYLANNILPARLGELVRSHALGEGEGISRTTVLGTVVVERIVDTVMVVVDRGASASLVLSARGVMTQRGPAGSRVRDAAASSGWGSAMAAHRLPGRGPGRRVPRAMAADRRARPAPARRPARGRPAADPGRGDRAQRARLGRLDHDVPRRRPGGRHRADARPGRARRDAASRSRRSCRPGRASSARSS